jgi:hypothetical protein
MALSEQVKALSVKPTRVLFARVGWMTYFAGPQPGDERPKGGGGYNKKNVGHELFNFAPFNGRLYGNRTGNGGVNLARIDPGLDGAKKLEVVLVVFVARQHIVGWYRGATVYATDAKLPISAVKEMKRRLRQSPIKGFNLGEYRFETAVENATLLPTYERKHQIPGNVKGGFGQSNVCYPYRNGGKSKKSAWMDKAIQYVLSYDRANLLSDPDAQVNSEEATEIAQEKAGGFQSDPKIRKAIEQHAMRSAQKALEKLGYGNFVNTSASKPYDFTCQKLGKPFFVEVKGTQTKGNSVILTKNEVENVRTNPGKCVLVVVHSVKIDGEKVSSAGTAEVTEKWVLTDGELTASQYVWKR